MLDHGQLNVPLHKRGNFHAELDRYKAEQAKIEKRKLEDRKFLAKESQSEAMVAYRSLSREAVKYYAKRAGISMTDARVELKAMCVNPKKALSVFNALIEKSK